jgi:hypothetical protein
VTDDAAELLHRARQEPRDVFDRDQWNVEGVAEAHEARRLYRRIDVERARQVCRLVGDDPDRSAAEPSEADDDVLREVAMDFEKRPLVRDRVDQIEHVVGLVRRCRH